MSFKEGDECIVKRGKLDDEDLDVYIGSVVIIATINKDDILPILTKCGTRLNFDELRHLTKLELALK